MTSAIDRQLEEKQEALEAEVRPEKKVSPLSKSGKMKYLITLLIALPLFVYLVADRWNSTDEEVALTVEPEELVVFQPVVRAEPPVSAMAVKEEEKVEPAAAELGAQTRALGDSDVFFREQLNAVLGNAFFASWAQKSESVRKATLVLDNLAQGQVSNMLATSFVLGKRFSATFIEDETFGKTQRSIYRLDPAGYRRYDSVVEVITKSDVEGLVQAYVALQPLFKTAYKELGYPAGSMDAVVLDALRKVRAAPVIKQDIQLVRPGVMYKFRDSKLEALSSLEKQLLRMGPANTLLLQEKARVLELAFEQVLVSD